MEEECTNTLTLRDVTFLSLLKPDCVVQAGEVRCHERAFERIVSHIGSRSVSRALATLREELVFQQLKVESQWYDLDAVVILLDILHASMCLDKWTLMKSTLKAHLEEPSSSASSIVPLDSGTGSLASSSSELTGAALPPVTGEALPPVSGAALVESDTSTSLAIMPSHELVLQRQQDVILQKEKRINILVKRCISKDQQIRRLKTRVDTLQLQPGDIQIIHILGIWRHMANRGWDETEKYSLSCVIVGETESV